MNDSPTSSPRPARSWHTLGRQWWARVRILATRQTRWTDPETGQVIIEREDWGTAWAIAGIHSYQWRWVRRFGSLDCGCTRNPITRRFVLYAGECHTHCPVMADLFEGRSGDGSG